MKIKHFFLFLILLFVSCSSDKHQQRYLVTTKTMSPTINPGDYVIDDPSINEYTYGDIIGYEYTLGDKKYKDVYRIVGLPGDSISIESDICIINGKKNLYKFIQKNDIFDEIEEILPNNLKLHILYHEPLFGDNYDFKTIQIPENNYFILGDFRTGAFDSRNFGTIPKEKITGKIVEVIKTE